MSEFALLLASIEPAVGEYYDELPHDVVAKYSCAISLKRIADAADVYMKEFNKGWTDEYEG